MMGFWRFSPGFSGDCRIVSYTGVLTFLNAGWVKLSKCYYLSGEPVDDIDITFRWPVF